MTPDHVATVLQTLGASYRTAVTGDMAELWYEHFVDLADDVATVAVDQVIRDEVYFPSPAVFRRYVPAARREVDAHVARHRPGPPTPCGLCDGERWYRGRADIGETFPRSTYETVRPCQGCAPAEFDRWRTFVADQAAKRRARRPEEFDYDPTPMLAETRAALRALADSLTEEEEV